MSTMPYYVNILTYSNLLATLRENSVGGVSGNQFSESMKNQLFLLFYRLKGLSTELLWEYDKPQNSLIHPLAPLASHNIRTSVLSMSIARELCLSSSSIELIGLGALLHDVGKLNVDQSVLNKPSSLSETEFAHIKTHAQLGYELLIQEDWLPYKALQIVLKHHERLDGSGYPHNLKAKQIGLCERIVAVADVYDAITSRRNYRQAVPTKEALNVMKKEAPHQLDPRVIKALECVTTTGLLEERKTLYAPIYG